MCDIVKLDDCIVPNGTMCMICGKLIWLDDGVCDFDDEKDVENILMFGKNLYEDGSVRALFGKDTVCHLIFSPKGESRAIASFASLDSFDDAIRIPLRRAVYGK